jgi:hypothetical protein
MNLEEENQLLKNQMTSMEGINFEFVNKGGKIKMIAWGQDYQKWDVGKRLEYAESLASALNDACDLIQKERNNFAVENRRLFEAALEAEKAMHTLRQTNINIITSSNQDKRDQAKIIKELEREITVLKAGITVS